MSQALVLIDLQNDYFPGGRMELVGADAAVAAAASLLGAFRERGLPVVHIRHLSQRPGATFFLPDTQGAEIHRAVEPLAGETVIVKHFPSAFRQTNLQAVLRELGASQVVFAGMMTHMCVDATARAAADFGFQVVVAEDACATRDLEYNGETIPSDHVHKSFLAALTAYGKVMKSGEIVAMLASEIER